MSMEPWFHNHDEWIAQLREFLKAHGFDEEEDLPDELLIFLSNLAAKVAKGDITIVEAQHELHQWISARLGYHYISDKETFELEAQFHDMIDVTEATKDNLLVVDQPGIANALGVVYALPEVAEMDGFYTDDEAMAGKPAIAIQSKKWFDVNGLSPAEHKDLWWAVGQAVRDHVAAN